jgi:hypothetical protein
MDLYSKYGKEDKFADLTAVQDLKSVVDAIDLNKPISDEDWKKFSSKAYPLN